MRKLRAVLVITWSTLQEALRNRLLVVAIFFALLLTMLSVAAASVSFSEQARLIIDVGLASASIVGSLTMVALAVVSFAREIREHTAYPWLARPYPRWVFVAGKFMGVTAAMQILLLLMHGATAAAVLLQGSSLPGAFGISVLLSSLEITVVAALALLFSTLATPVLAASYSVGFLVIGNFTSDVQVFVKKLSETHAGLARLLEIVQYVLPDLAAFSARTQAANDLIVPGRFVLYATGYALSYAGVSLLLAMFIFERRKTV